MLLEAAERVGVVEADLLSPLGLEAGALRDVSRRVEWSTLVAVIDRIALLLGGDRLRMEDVGRAMTYVPGNDALRRLARMAVSVRTLYDLAERWVVPGNFPHLRLFMKIGPSGRLLVHGSIPDAHAPCEAFFHLCTGAMSEAPAFLGLPPARIVEVRTDPRTFDLALQLPEQRSFVSRAARVVRAAMRASDVPELLEEQRRALADGLESVQHARDELRSLLERLPDMVLIHVDTKVVFVNRALVKALGWSHPDELVGKSLYELVDPRSMDLARSRVARAPDSPEVPALTEAWVVTRAGGSIHVEVAPTQHVVFDGKPARLLVGRNIGERARLQEQLMAADRLASLGLLAAGVAHEVNNPLAYVLNNIEIARKQLPTSGKPAEVAREALTVALEGVDRIRFIVNELLQLARGDSGAVGPTDVRAVVESTLALARVEVARKAKLVVDYQPAPPAQASVPRVSQIVLNLVLNAVEAMKSDDVDDNEITVRVGTSGDGRVLLEVADNGVGVAPEGMSRVFEPFYTTKPEGQGTGLGLPITQRLVLELGGAITFTSTPGRGTTFRVVLPVAEAPAA